MVSVRAVFGERTFFPELAVLLSSVLTVSLCFYLKYKDCIYYILKDLFKIKDYLGTYKMF